MDKAQAIHQFWSSFGLPAYDENTIPNNAIMPYITYNVSTDALNGILNLYANLWYDSYSWKEITNKADEIAEAIGKNGFYSIKIDNGYLWLTLDSPFAQRMSEPGSDSIRRIFLMINAEFLTSY